MHGRLIGGAVVIGAAVAAGVTVLALVGPGGKATTPVVPATDGVRSTAVADSSNVLAKSITATQAQLREEPV